MNNEVIDELVRGVMCTGGAEGPEDSEELVSKVEDVPAMLRVWDMEL